MWWRSTRIWTKIVMTVCTECNNTKISFFIFAVHSTLVFGSILKGIIIWSDQSLTSFCQWLKILSSGISIWRGHSIQVAYVTANSWCTTALIIDFFFSPFFFAANYLGSWKCISMLKGDGSQTSALMAVAQNSVSSGAPALTNGNDPSSNTRYKGKTQAVWHWQWTLTDLLSYTHCVLKFDLIVKPVYEDHSCTMEILY